MIQKRKSLTLNILLCLLTSLILKVTDSFVPCSTSNECQRKLSSSLTVCKDGKCTNPFEQGCLKTMAERYGKKIAGIESIQSNISEKKHICYSDDPNKNEMCRKSDWVELLQLKEIRIASGKTGVGTFGLILQILLTEVLEVPTTIEHGQQYGNGKASFYDRSMQTYNSDYNQTESLVEAYRVGGNCKSSNNLPCSHIIPDVNYFSNEVLATKDMNEIFPLKFNGRAERKGFYIPKFTVEQHPEFATYVGFSKEQQRQKVASTFLKPTTWGEYYSEVRTEADCASGKDMSAQRLPLGDDEKNRYFVKGLFEGFFRNTTDTDCTNNSDCFGHFISLSATREQYKMDLNNIPMRSLNNYSARDVKEIWYAANNTKSDVMILLETPSNSEWYELHKSNVSLLRVKLPNPWECIQNKFFFKNNYCDFSTTLFTNISSSTLKTMYDSAPVVSKSPAFDFLNSVNYPKHSVQQIYEEQSRISSVVGEIDGQDYSQMFAVCKYVYNNLGSFESSFPKGYQRKIEKQSTERLANTATSISIIALFCIMLAVMSIYWHRDKPAIRYAQYAFLIWIMGGMSSSLSVILLFSLLIYFLFFVTYLGSPKKHYLQYSSYRLNFHCNWCHHKLF